MQLLESVSALSGSGAMAWLLIAIPLASAAFLLPFSAIARRRVVLAEEKAVSVAEK